MEQCRIYQSQIIENESKHEEMRRKLIDMEEQRKNVHTYLRILFKSNRSKEI